MPHPLDANVFIQAKNLHYGFDFCPGFWHWLEQAHAAGTVCSVSQVGDELAAGTDALADWAKARGQAFFREPDKKSLPEPASVSQWIVNQRYEPAAINTFLQVADYYLVAYAKAHGYTVVVTHELPADSIRKIKIPNVCVGLGVHYVNAFQMLSRERVRLVLDGFARHEVA